MVGVVAAHARCVDGTELEIDTPQGARRVHFPAVADPDGAARVLCTLRRPTVQLTVVGAEWRASVLGIGHRRPVTLPISNATALALVERGVPAVVTLS